MSDNLLLNGYPIAVRSVEIPGRRIYPAGIDSGTGFVADRSMGGAACRWAADTLLPFTATLRFAGDLSWAAESGLVRAGYPGPHSSVVLKAREGDGHA